MAGDNNDNKSEIVEEIINNEQLIHLIVYLLRYDDISIKVLFKINI